MSEPPKQPAAKRLARAARRLSDPTFAPLDPAVVTGRSRHFRARGAPSDLAARVVSPR